MTFCWTWLSAGLRVKRLFVLISELTHLSKATKLLIPYFIESNDLWISLTHLLHSLLEIHQHRKGGDILIHDYCMNMSTFRLRRLRTLISFPLRKPREKLLIILTPHAPQRPQ